MLGAAVAVVLATASLAVAPSRASAYWSPVTVDGSSAMGWFNRTGEYTGRWISNTTWTTYVRQTAAAASANGVGSTTGYTATELNVGKTAYDALRTTSTAATTVVSVQQAKAQQLSLMAQVKSWGALKTLGSIGLAATIFELGWKSGSLLADVLGIAKGEGTIEGSLTRNAVSVIGVEAGESLPVFSGTPLGAKAVEPGFIVQFNCAPTSCGTLTVVQPHAAADSEGTCANRKLVGIPTAAVFVQTEVAQEFCGGKVRDLVSGVYIEPARVTELPGSGVPTTSPEPTRETAAPSPLPAEVAVPIVEECMQSKSCEGVAGHYFHHLPEVAGAVQVEPGYAADATIPDPSKVTVPSPGVDETYDLYLDRLTELGLVGQAQELTETAIDTTRGPLVVTQVVPEVGSQLAPGSPVRVRYNPENAPEAAAPLDPGSCDASIDNVDLSPLNAPVGEKFPFGILVFFVDWVDSWSASSATPEFDFPLVGSLELHVDLSVMEPAMGPVRAAIIFGSFVGLLWFLGTAAMRLNGDSS